MVLDAAVQCGGDGVACVREASGKKPHARTLCAGGLVARGGTSNPYMSKPAPVARNCRHFCSACGLTTPLDPTWNCLTL